MGKVGICPIAVAASAGLLRDKIVIVWNKINTLSTEFGKEDAIRNTTSWLLEFLTRICKRGHNYEWHILTPKISVHSLHVELKILLNRAIRCKYQHNPRIWWNKQNFILPSRQCRSIQPFLFSKQEKANNYWHICEEEKQKKKPYHQTITAVLFPSPLNDKQSAATPRWHCWRHLTVLVKKDRPYLAIRKDCRDWIQSRPSAPSNASQWTPSLKRRLASSKTKNAVFWRQRLRSLTSKVE